MSSTRSYEDLEGGCGRERFFRPPRYKEANPVQSQSAVSFYSPLTGQRVSYCLHDISQNGVSFFNDGETLNIGDVLRETVVTVNGYPVYQGESTVRSKRRSSEDEREIVGLNLSDYLIDIEDVVRLKDLLVGVADNNDALVASKSPWYFPGCDQFKALVAELRLFLEQSKAYLDSLEKHLPWHVVHGEQQTATRTALFRMIEETFVPSFLKYAREIDRSLRSADKEAWSALKEFSLANVLDFFLMSPLMHRCRFKPLGYPGDYEVMNMLYRRAADGATLFAKALNLGAQETAASVAVRSRKDMIRDRLLDLVRQHQGEERLRVFSVASGPAQEVYEVLESLDPSYEIEVVLFDQDRQALSFAYARLRSLLVGRRRQDTIRYFYDSVKRLITDPDVFRDFQPFDVIVCSGLFDYLSDRTFLHLLAKLSGLLKPGGELYVGNMTPQNWSRWIMEHVLDWTLNYRDRDAILELGRAALPQNDISLMEEPTGVNPFLVVRGS